MKILICGAGRITDELLKRIGENWQITLIDKTADKLTPFSNRFPSVVRLLAEDASSPVVLEKAGLSEQDCVLALTNEDPVNLAIVRFAQQTDVKNVLSVVRNPEMLPEFQELGIWTVSLATDMARKIYQFLKDPRIRIIPLGEGEGELMELAAGKPDLPPLQDLFAQTHPERIPVEPDHRGRHHRTGIRVYYRSLQGFHHSPGRGHLFDGTQPLQGLASSGSLLSDRRG